MKAITRSVRKAKPAKVKPGEVKPSTIWRIGTAALRKKQGWSNGSTWEDVCRNPGQLAGWTAVADWINNNFVRKSLIILAILPVSVVPAAEALLRL